MEEEVLELKQFFGMLRRWWWLMILLAVIGAGTAYYLTPEPVPIYEASTTVLISQGRGGLPDVGEVSAGQRLATTYGELMRTRPLLEEVIANLQIAADPDDLTEQVRVTNLTGTNLLVLTVEADNPQSAASIANEIVRVFIEQNSQLQASRYAASKADLQTEISGVQEDIGSLRTSIDQIEAEIQRAQERISALDTARDTNGTLTPAQSAELDTLTQQVSDNIALKNDLQVQLDQYQLRYEALLQSYEDIRLAEAEAVDFMSVVEQAQPGQPIRTAPRKLINAIQAAAAGLAVGGLFSFLVESLRESIMTSEDIEKLTGFPTLGVIANIRGAEPPEKLVTARQPRAPIAEAYRVLRANIEFAAADGPPRTLVVTSSSPVEGKTTTAANLAVVIAQSGKTVILVDTDLRRPAIHKLFEQVNTRGVTTALVHEGGGMVTDHLLHSGIENLYLMPSGPLPPNPAGILGSARMVDLIEELKAHADIVIFDTPPLLAVADATLLARVCDGAVLVVQAGSTRPEMLRRAKDQVLQSGATVLGVVLNRVSGSRDGYYSHYYYYYK